VSRWALAIGILVALTAACAPSGRPVRSWKAEAERALKSSREWESAAKAYKAQAQQWQAESLRLGEESNRRIEFWQGNAEFWRGMAQPKKPAIVLPHYGGVALPAGYPAVEAAWKAIVASAMVLGYDRVAEIVVTHGNGDAIAWVQCLRPRRIYLERDYVAKPYGYDLETTLAHEVRHVVQCTNGEFHDSDAWQREAETAALAYEWWRQADHYAREIDALHSASAVHATVTADPDGQREDRR